jgi:hypothetical protein
MKYRLLLLFTLLSFSVYSQDMFISSSSGTVNILSGNSTTAAKKGSKILKVSTLQLKENSTAMVVDTKGRSVYLKAAGSYTYSALTKMLGKVKEDDLLKGYAQMLMKNMFSHDDAGQTSVTTAVHRGIDPMMRPGDYSIIINDALTFEWFGPRSKVWMKLIISDSTHVLVDTLFTEPSGTIRHCKIPLELFKAATAYKWKAEISPNREASDHYFHFLIADKADSNAIRKDIQNIQTNPNYKEMKRDLMQYVYTKWEMYYRRRK